MGVGCGNDNAGNMGFRGSGFRVKGKSTEGSPLQPQVLPASWLPARLLLFDSLHQALKSYLPRSIKKRPGNLM